MTIRVTGLNSGLDTDSIIQELMSAYNTKTEKYEKEQTKIGWKQEIWSDLNTKVNSFYKSVGNLRYSSGYSTYKTTSSDSTKATASVSGTAVTGSYKLHVLSTAQSAYLTGGKLSSTSGSVTSDTTLKELGYTASNTKLRVTTKDDDGNDVYTDIDVSSSSTISDVVSKIKDAGVNASFDSTNGRIYVSSKTGGVAGDFQITQVTGSVESDGGALLSALGFSTYGKTASGSSTMSELGFTQQSGALVVSVDGADYQFDVSSSTTVSTLLSQMNTKLKDTGVVAYQDSTTGQIKLQNNNNVELKVQQSTTKLDENGDPAAELSETGELLTVLGINSDGTSAERAEEYDDTKAVKIASSDAAIVLNGVVYTSTSNNFSINGLNITVSGTTDDINDLLDENGELDKLAASKLNDNTAVTLSTSVDAQSIYDTIKDFLTNYNSIINELTKLYNADSASDYEPLTDDEKSEMTDTEISKWETKIKDSLLRRDTSLSTLMSAMKNSMAKTYEVNGKKYALSSFGISTLYYGTAPENEESAFHIDGDEDDENTSGNTDKLLAAITEDPDSVISFMKQLTTSLYTAIDNQMQSSSVRSRYSIYNDKELQDQYDDYTTIISDWEDKVADKEDYYYDKFASMETALGNLNNQTSALSGLIG
jgi:flagellar hook-associated protein 2